MQIKTRIFIKLMERKVITVFNYAHKHCKLKAYRERHYSSNILQLGIKQR
jgi:hypothetical protein